MTDSSERDGTEGQQQADQQQAAPQQADPQQADQLQGPGWMPAILAATALMGILGFLVCAFSTWLLFQKRTELAIRTLRGAYIVDIEQSHLARESKTAVVNEIKQLADDLERGKYEDWQAAGIMQRLQRLPVIQWGEVQAVEANLRAAGGDQLADDLRQLSRLQRAVELGSATSFDFEDVLSPVRRTDSNSPSGFELMQPMDAAKVDEVVHRARLLADRSDIPDEDFEVRIEAVVRREIERGGKEGGY